LAEDVHAYVACWHDDMRIEMPTGVIDGAARYRKLVVGSFAWAAPVSFDVHHLAVDGPNDIVFADWTIRARRRDDDVVVEWRGLSVCELRDGRIAWWREHHLRAPGPASG
jgi:limonene-1,2-epoxide hydrolase